MQDRLSDTPSPWADSGPLQALLSDWKASERLYTLEGAGAVGGLLVESFAVVESLSEGFQMRITALSLDGGFDLQALLGQKLTLHTTLSDGSRCSRSGLVSHALGPWYDGGWARFELVTQPALFLLGHTSHSRLWQDKSILDVIADVLGAPDYQGLIDWRFGEQGDDGEREDLDAFLAQGPGQGQRGLITQYRETDLAFITRLLASEGLNWRVEEASDAPAGHRIVVFADGRRCPQNPTAHSPVGGPGIQFQRGDATEEQDAIQAFGHLRSLNPTASAVLSWNYTSKSTVAASVPTHHQFGGPSALALADWLEDYEPSTQTGDTDAPATSGQLQHSATLVQEAFEARNKTWLARSTVRSLRAGQWFGLTQSELDTQGRSDEDKQFLVLHVAALGINNLPSELRRSLSHGLAGQDAQASDLLAALHGPHRLDPRLQTLCDDPELLERALAQGHANRFEAIRRHIPWRPLPLRAPTALGMQTAIVVGPGGNTTPSGADELYTDALGRIKVQFHWQGAAHADGRADNRSTCWVRVVRGWAGPRMGAQFIPRIGQEVLVDFLDGNMDRPVVVDALYNGRGEAGLPATPGGQPGQSELSPLAQSGDHQPSGQGNLMGSGAGGHAPAWHGGAPGPATEGAQAQNNPAALSGIKTKEFGGEGFNQLVFDDTDQQQRVQLATTQFGTHLTLGHLIHQADNHRGSLRGQGFELRTDAYGGVRAARGVLLTTYSLRPGEPGSAEPAGDNAPGMALFKQACMLTDTLNQAARAHQTTTQAAAIGSTKAGQGVLSEKEAPLKAIHTALSGMVDPQDVNAALQDAADRTTATQGKLPHLADPLVAVMGKAGLALVAGQDVEVASQDVISLQSGRDTQVGTGAQLRLQTGQSLGVLAGAVQPGGQGAEQARGKGLTLVNGQGPIDVQAQAGTLEVAAKALVNVQSANAHIDWAAAKKITLQTGGGATIVIDASGIHQSCPGTITVHAATKSFVGPAGVSYPLPQMPQSICVECLLNAMQSASPLAALA
jgi:type VI secretion system secreted protein VgrG